MQIICCTPFAGVLFIFVSNGGIRLKTKRLKKLTTLMLILALSLQLCSCGSQNTDGSRASEEITQDTAQEYGQGSSQSDAAEYDGRLEFDYSMPLTYAKNFSVDYYKGGYKMIKVADSGSFLIVPDKMSVPKELDSSINVLQQPVTKIMISSTPTISLINAIGALDAVSLTTADVDTWYIEDVKTQMNSGRLQYVGSYSEPDYELITSVGTNFAIFSGMLTGDVKAALEQLGVTVMVDKASDESHPLARVEWVKLYGAMFNREAEAEKVFAEQEKIVKDIEGQQSTGKSVVMFYITTKGDFYVRNSDDYMAKMINLAKGEYIMDGKVGVGKSGTTKMEAEAFFELAKDADAIIYVWSMGGKPSTLQDFLDKNEILSEMKAVKEGNVWCTTPDFFQISSTLGNMVSDINKMLNSDSSEEQLTYLFKLK